jgi:hypothetical protein
VLPVSVTTPDPEIAAATPVQVVAKPFGVATTSPAGRLSVKPIPVSGIVFAAGLLIVNVRLAEPLRGMLAAPKAFTIVGGVATVKFAVAVLPVPPFVEETVPVVFTKLPDAVPVTFTVNVQVLLAAIVPPVNEMLPEPATAVATPPQVLVSPFGVATTIPAGSVSVNATPVSVTAFAAGFVIVNVSDVVPFSGRLDAPKAFAIDGGTTTLMLADAVPPVPPSVEVTFPVLLFFVPAVVPVTFTAKVHEVEAARDAPARLTTFVACVAVIAPPPHDPVNPFGVEITNPAGRVSVNPTPVRVAAVLLF